jgi:hypothetical protein
MLHQKAIRNGLPFLFSYAANEAGIKKVTLLQGLLNLKEDAEMAIRSARYSIRQQPNIILI